MDPLTNASCFTFKVIDGMTRKEGTYHIPSEDIIIRYTNELVMEVFELSGSSESLIFE